MTNDELLNRLSEGNLTAFDEMRAEPLVPELHAYLERDERWEMLRHPLVYDVPYSGLGGLMNRRLEAKRAAVIEAAKNGDIEHLVWLHERPWRLWAFLREEVGIDMEMYEPEECPSLWEMDERAQQLALSIWSDSENITFYQRWWMALFAPESRFRAGRVLADEEGKRLWEHLPETFTVYKGGEPSGESFLSWTTDYDTAEFFARRGVSGNDKPRKVIERQITKAQVFAVIGGRGESEVLALPN